MTSIEMSGVKYGNDLVTEKCNWHGTTNGNDINKKATSSENINKI